jgi:hypothetical protein
MRKIFVIAALLLSAAVSSAYAKGDPEINQKVRNAFLKQFSGATNVQWQNQDELSIAVFLINGIRAAAYYDQEGKLHATIRTIFYNQLPLVVMSAITDKFKNPTIVNVSEITNSNGTHYNIVMESDNKKYDLEADTSGNLLAVRTIK